MGRFSHLAAALLGAACVGAAWLFLGGPPQDARVAALPDGDRATASATQEELLERMTRIERALEDVQTAVAARPADDDGFATLAGRAPSGSSSGRTTDSEADGSAESTPLVTDEVLERTLERLERKRTEGLSDVQLLAEARRQLNRERDYNTARKLLETLLDRDVPEETRLKALVDLGTVNRELQDYEASERALREAMRVAGPDSSGAVTAGYHLVWTYSAAKRPREGLALADDLLRSPGAVDGYRPWLRWAAARMALDSGDVARARNDFRQLREECKDDPRLKQIAEDSTARLRSID